MYIFLILIFSLHVHSQYKPVCSWSDMEKNCDAIRAHIAHMKESKNPGIKIPSFEDKRVQLEGIFQKVKNAMLQEILSGRSEDQLSSSEMALLAKIKTVRMISPDQVGHSCTTQLNGKYYSDLHAFVICPGFNFLPDTSYMATMTHEITHAIDPCLSQFGLVKLNFQKIESARVVGRFDNFIQSEIDDWKYDVNEFNLRVRDQNPRSVERWRGKYSSKELQQMSDFGLISDIAPGVSAADYPFKAAMGCLKAIGVKMPDDKLPLRDESGVSVFPHCPGRVIGAQSQASESMSDLFSGQVMSRLLASEKLDSRTPDMTYWLLQQGACKRREAAPGRETLYLSSSGRADKLIFSNKKLRNALGCPVPIEEQKDCSEQLSPQRRLKPPLTVDSESYFSLPRAQ